MILATLKTGIFMENDVLRYEVKAQNIRSGAQCAPQRQSLFLYYFNYKDDKVARYK